MDKRTVKIFISYARKDELYFNLLKDGIAAHTKHSNKFQWDTWCDQDILPGQKWHEAIIDKVKASDCALLFVTANFLYSDYIEQHEFNEFVNKQEQGKFRFFPVLISPCDITQWSELAKRQFFRAEGKKYGRPEKDGLLSYADLVAFDKGLPLPNPERDRYHLDLVQAMEKAIDAFLAEIEPQEPKTALPAVKSDTKSAKTSVKLGNVFISPIDTDNWLERQDDKIMPLAMQAFRFKQHELNKRSDQQQVEEVFQIGNQLTRLILDDIHQLQEKVLDSDHLKQLYVHVHFNEIAYGDHLDYSTEQTILHKRQQRARFPWYERSLIVSALTLSLLQQFDVVKVYHLIDFIRDKEDFVWKRALTGLVMTLLLHEEKITKELREDLLILQEDEEIQKGIIEIFEELASEGDDEEMEKYKVEVDFDASFEFFEKPQHWFLPFYPDNPVLLDKIWDRQLRDTLPKSSAWQIDVFKYAYCLSYNSLDAAKKAKITEKIDRAAQRAMRWRQWNLDKYPMDEPELAYRRAGEYKTYVQEIFFFIANYSMEQFQAIQLEKKSLYQTKLSEILLKETYLLYAEAVHYYFFSEEYEQALPILKQLHEVFPNDTSILWRIAYCYDELKDYDQAITYQQKIVKLESKNAKNWAMLGFYNKRKEEYEKAIEYYLKAKQIDETYTWNLIQIADCYDELGKFEQAIAYQMRAAKLEPDNANIWRLLGYYYQQNKEYDKALEFRLKAEMLDEKDAWNLAGIAFVYNQLSNYEQAIAYQIRAAELEPDNAGRWGMLGHYYEQNKEYGKALEVRLKAEQMNPDMAWNLAGIASCYDELENYDQAIAYQTRAAELEPEDADRWGMLGHYYEQNKEYEKALEVRLKAEQMNPDMAWNLAGIAVAYDKLENYKQAIAYQTRAAELEPNNASRWGSLGHYYEQNKEYEKALEVRLKAEQMNPDMAWNLAGIAVAYDKLENYKQAIAYQTRAAELEPEELGRWDTLGRYYLFNNQEKEAEQNFDKALKIDFAVKEKNPNDPYIHGSIGWTYFLKGDYRNAREYFEKEILLTTEEKWTYHPFANIGHLELINGNVQLAEQFYHNAIEVALQNNTFKDLWDDFEEDFILLERQGISKEAYWDLLNDLRTALESKEEEE